MTVYTTLLGRQYEREYPVTQDQLNAIVSALPLPGLSGAAFTFTPQSAPPPTPFVGMVADADGVNWNPGSGAGLYVYLGGGWVAFGVLTSVQSVSNTDGTLTISPTTGAVVASLNLAHANIWSATQTFSNSTNSAIFNNGPATINPSAATLTQANLYTAPELAVASGVAHDAHLAWTLVIARTVRSLAAVVSGTID